MKNDCGHDASSENSVLRCDDCEAERFKRDSDAEWNAAIEAAAKAMGDDRNLFYGTEAARRVLALKREAK